LKIIGLIWTDKTIEKLVQKHNVQQDEVHEVFGSNPKFRFVRRDSIRMKMYMPPLADQRQAGF